MGDSETDRIEADAPEISPWSAPIADSEIATTEALESLPCLWGPWATIGWTLLCIVVLFGAQIIGAHTLRLVQKRHNRQPESR